MSKVFVIDSYYQPLNPVHPGRARLLLKQGKASVYRRFPFTIILKAIIEQPMVAPLRLKIDPGSKTTGIAVVNEKSGEVVFAANLEHRGEEIKKRLDDRRAIRRSRRHRKTRYRAPRFNNRKRKKGWLPPSLESRVSNSMTWVNRLCRSCPIAAISQELVKFDLQKMEKPEISGVEYQHGFPRTSPKGPKQVHGFQTGDRVRAIVPFGKKSGTYVGRVAIRATGSFNITNHIRTIQGISHRGCHILHKSDGYSYGLGTLIPSPKKGAPIPPLV